MLQYINRNKAVLLAGVAAVVMLSCEYETRELAGKPTASFTVTPVSGQINKYVVASNSQGAFLYDWDKADGKGYKRGKAVDTVYFAKKGDYNVKLITYGENGMDSTSQVIKVAADDPINLKILTNNGTKTWVLIPDAGALEVGQNDATVWWKSGVADVTDSKRTCLFNDEYTFSMDGKFVFNDKGDFRVDDEASNPWPTDIGLAIGCYATSAIPAKYQAWGSGNFTFSIEGDKLKVIGTGAHLGLYKAGQTGTTAVPEADNTYDIVSLTATKLVVKKVYSWGQWKFTFVPKP
jgi:hypothetical protein